MNLFNLEQSIYEQLGFEDEPDKAVVRRIRRNINQAHHEVLALKGIGGHLRRKTLPLTTVANSKYAVLPQMAVQVFAIADRTNDNPLEQVSIEEIVYSDPGDHAVGGIPYQYCVVGYAEPVALDPSDASELFVKSDSASDGATKTAYIEGVITGGYPRSASVALNGITAASLSASITSWISVRKFYIALTGGGLTTAAGNVTLMEDSGSGTELARIGIGDAYPRYTKIQLYPIPSTAATLYADVELLINDMSKDTDESVLPDDFQWLLECGALQREYRRREKIDLYEHENMRWRMGIADLRMFLQRRSGVTFSDRRARRFSMLGPYYPVGS